MNVLAFGVTEYILLAISLVVIIALIIAVFLSLRKKLLQRFALLHYFYPIIRKTAVYHDYYLINKLEIKLNNRESLYIDHILFGNKYIYVINDYIYKGVLSGNPQDSKWILKNKQGDEEIIDSPFLKTKHLVQKLSLRTGIDHNTFVGITLVSVDTKITDLNVNDSQNFIIDTRDFMKLVLKIEGRDIAPLNAEELKKRVHEIDDLNLRREKGSKWPKKK
ncbi:MAG: NERD domain-containing protein [Bacilli bacterium]